MAKMWAGRTDGTTEKIADDFNSSIHFDCRMYRQDITGSMAHAAMLAAQNIISQTDADQLIAGLEEILQDLDSGKLHLYQVATLVPMGGVVYDFQLLDVLSAAGATLDTEDLYDGAQSERLLAAAQTAMPSGYMTTPIADGKARFENLDAGLYLVWQDKAGACEGYDPIHPFLISVPRLQDGAYTMHVVADPKVPLHTEPTPPPPPPPPPPPDIPQTGQMNWPIPVMAVAGTVLLVVGCILLAGRKRAGHEE